MNIRVLHNIFVHYILSSVQPDFHQLLVWLLNSPSLEKLELSPMFHKQGFSFLFHKVGNIYIYINIKITVIVHDDE